MLEDFVAYVPFAAVPRLAPVPIEQAITSLEPERPAAVTSEGGGLKVELGNVQAVISLVHEPMPEEQAMSSIGMADMPEPDRARLLQHKVHAQLTCSVIEEEFPTTAIIMLLKTGMALCDAGGMAFCLPASGICLLAPALKKYAEINAAGPRAWGVDDSEADLGNYEKLTLWDSLRAQGEPDGLMVGFVPAQIDGKTWFFSAGHSLFNMPELAFSTGNIDDYAAVKEFFRVVFRAYFGNREGLRAGQTIPISDMISLSMEALPPTYRDFESSTGTLMVRILETFAPDKDWD